MKEQKLKNSLLENIRTTLDASCEQIDEATIVQLRKARFAALDAEQQKISFRQLFRFPAAGLATASAAALAVFIYFNAPQSDLISPHGEPDDMEILLSVENPDFFVDLDFYSWLAEEQDSAA